MPENNWTHPPYNLIGPVCSYLNHCQAIDTVIFPVWPSAPWSRWPDVAPLLDSQPTLDLGFSTDILVYPPDAGIDTKHRHQADAGIDTKHRHQAPLYRSTLGIAFSRTTRSVELSVVFNKQAHGACDGEKFLLWVLWSRPIYQSQALFETSQFREESDVREMLRTTMSQSILDWPIF